MSSPERLGPPPVDPLSDMQWARVERNVFSRMEGTVTGAVSAREVKHGRGLASTWIWLAVPAAAAAAFGLAFFSMNGPSGSASDGEPSRVVASDSPTTMSFGDAHVTLQARSAVLMEQNVAKPTALLEHGSAVFAVAPRGERAPFTVLAGDTSARTMGATFTVTRTGERADIKVSTGTIDIRFRGRDVRLAANQSWSSDRPTDAPNAASDSQR
jgi:ferric-dicitrate binding protein FerR (iron transport regulator)